MHTNSSLRLPSEKFPWRAEIGLGLGLGLGLKSQAHFNISPILLRPDQVVYAARAIRTVHGERFTVIFVYADCCAGHQLTLSHEAQVIDVDHLQVRGTQAFFMAGNWQML